MPPSDRVEAPRAPPPQKPSRKWGWLALFIIKYAVLGYLATNPLHPPPWPPANDPMRGNIVHDAIKAWKWWHPAPTTNAPGVLDGWGDYIG